MLPDCPARALIRRSCGRLLICTRFLTLISGRECCSKRCWTCRPRCFSQLAEWTGFPTPSREARRYCAVRCSRQGDSQDAARCKDHIYGCEDWSATKSIEADYCICALPISILKTIPNDFSPRVKQAITEVGYDSAYKVAWESRRFWEQDYNLYGGLSFVVKGPVNLVWYPSWKLFSDNGSFVAGYGVENHSEFRQSCPVLRPNSTHRARRSRSCTRASARS